jgi:protein-disulfide isomerase
MHLTMKKISDLLRKTLRFPVCFENGLNGKQRQTLSVFASTLLALSFINLPRTHAQQQQPAKKAEPQMDLRRDIEELKAGQQAIQKDLQELKKLLMARQPTPAEAPPREVTLDIAGAYFKGEKNARLTLIEFSDYQCPFCSRYVRDTLPLIERDYIKTGKVKYVFRDFPLESIHPNALLASEAAACAGEQGKYWEMHDRLFGNPGALGVTDIPTHAQSVGLNPDTFRQCLNSNKHKESIRKGITEALGLGVNGTPTFLIGLTSPNDSKVKILRALKGSPPYANFKEVLDGILASAL